MFYMTVPSLIVFLCDFKQVLFSGRYCNIYMNKFVPAGIYLPKVNNRNIRVRYEICSKLTIKTPEPSHWRRSEVFIVNFEHISHLVLVFLFLTFNI